MMVDDDTGIDPQLPILLRTLFEKGQEQETLTRGTGTGLGVGANSLSNLPGLNNAGSKISGLFVAAKIITPVSFSKPSI